MSLSDIPTDGDAAVGAGFFKEIILDGDDETDVEDVGGGFFKEIILKLVGVDEEVAGTVFFKEIIFEEDAVVETEVTFEVAIKAVF